MKCIVPERICILFSLYLFVQLTQVGSAFSCCASLVPIDNEDVCADGNKIRLQCYGDRFLLNKASSSIGYFTIENDGKGEYLDIPYSGWIVRAPHFCIGEDKDGLLQKNNNTVAVFCLTDRILKSEIENELVKKKSYQESKLQNFEVFLVVIIVMNFVSGLFLFITSYIYFILPQTNDVEGRCTFHLTLSLSFLHMIPVYYLMFPGNDIWLDMCITHLYVVIYIWLSMFAWSSVLSYHMWNRFRENRRFDESKSMTRYLIFGYGIPALLVLFSNIYAHAISLYTKNSFELRCIKHQNLVLLLFTILPMIACIFANGFFFIELQRRLWSVQPSNLRGQTSSLLKRAQYRLTINLKLFIIMGIPWLLLLIFVICSRMFLRESFVTLLLFEFLGYVFSVEGILIFFIMVIGRKRVCRGLVDKFGISKWKPNADAEESAESVCEDNVDVGEGSHIHVQNVA